MRCRRFLIGASDRGARDCPTRKVEVDIGNLSRASQSGGDRSDYQMRDSRSLSRFLSSILMISVAFRAVRAAVIHGPPPCVITDCCTMQSRGAADYRDSLTSRKPRINFVASNTPFGFRSLARSRYISRFLVPRLRGTPVG